MDYWNWLEYAAWALSVLLGGIVIADWIRTDTTYTEAQLTSSREGELEALSEKHRL